MAGLVLADRWVEDPSVDGHGQDEVNEGFRIRLSVDAKSAAVRLRPAPAFVTFSHKLRRDLDGG